MKNFPAFTMIELVFVIVVIGILSAIAIPRFAVTRDDAILVKVKSQVSSIRSGIAMQKNKNLLEGKMPPFPGKLDQATTPDSGDQKLFNDDDGNSSNILEYPIYSKPNHDGSWVKSGDNTYKVQISSVPVHFQYDNTTGIFDCNRSATQVELQDCKDLTQ